MTHQCQHNETLGHYIDDKGRTVERRLTIKTYKSDSRKCLMSTATVVNIDPENPMWFTHLVYQDFTERLAMNSDRATAKNIERMHAESLRELPTVLACARAHYRDWI